MSSPKVLGHSDIKATQRYPNITDERLWEAACRGD